MRWQILIYFILSLLVVLLARYLHFVVVYIDLLYTYMNVLLKPLFSISESGILLRNIISLTLIPIVITGIPALIYRAIFSKRVPYYYEATWLVWLAIVVSKIII